MRISIWQQWASNHSGFFTLVGTFQTPEAVQQASDRLLRLFQDIADWYQRPENEDAQKLLWTADYSSPTPVELAFAKELGIEWGRFGIDWFPERGDTANIVRVDGQQITVENCITDAGPEPIDQVLVALGAQVDVEMDISQAVRALLELTCVAPSAEAAEDIVQSAARFISGHSEPPWSKHGWELFGRNELHVVQEGMHLAFHNTRTGEYGIRELVNFLDARGCRDIDYRVEWS